MIVQPAVKTEQAPSLPAESSGPQWKTALYHAAYAGCLGAATLAWANAIVIHPGCLTLGVGFGLAEESAEAKTNRIAVITSLIITEGMILGTGRSSLTLAGSMIGGAVGGEGIAAMSSMVANARKNIGWGISTGALSFMIINWMTNSGGNPILDPLFVGLLSGVAALGLSLVRGTSVPPSSEKNVQIQPAKNSGSKQ
jgi:hypothetical protein